MKFLYDRTIGSALWVANTSYNMVANIPGTLWNAIPSYNTNTQQQSNSEREVLLAQDAIQNTLPLNERRNVIESHNAYAVKDDIAASNQMLPLEDQLNTGIPTIIELDIHPDGSGSVRLCHGDSSDICLTPKLTFEDALKTIHDHAERHPDRVFIVNLEDHFLAENRTPESIFDVVASKIENTLGNRLWRADNTRIYYPTSPPYFGTSNLTPNEMLSSGKNIALTSQCLSGRSTKYKNENGTQIAFQLDDLLGFWQEYSGIDPFACRTKRTPHTRITEDGMFIKLGQQTFDQENLSHARKCGISTIALDNITPERPLKGLTWLTTNDGTLPKDGLAFIDAEGNVNTVRPDNTIPVSEKHAACLEMETLQNRNRTEIITRPKDRSLWHTTSSLIGWNQADAACKAEFGVDFSFSTPKNGFEHALLHQNRTEPWINLELSHPSPNTLCLNTPSNGEIYTSCVSNNYPSLPPVSDQVFQLASNSAMTLGYSFIIPPLNHALSEVCGKDRAWYALKGLQYGSLLLLSTSSLTSLAIGQSVEYGLTKTGLTTPTTALYIGTATNLTLSAAQKATYWGVAELLVHSASSVIGSYLGAKSTQMYSTLIRQEENDFSLIKRL